MPKVFISYRREDSAAEAGRILDKLVSKLGEPAIFFDINTISLLVAQAGMPEESKLPATLKE